MRSKIEHEATEKLSHYLYDEERYSKFGLSSKLKLDQNALTHIEKLLIEGANPNYQNDRGDSLLYEAIRNSNVELVRLLLRYGADVNQHFIPPQCIADPTKKSEIFDWAYKNGATSLELAARTYCSRREEEFTFKDPSRTSSDALICYGLISDKFIIPPKFDYDRSKIQLLYSNLYKIFKIEHDQSKDNKPLLIVLGEGHVSLISFMIECMALHIAKEFNFNNVFCEVDENSFETVKNGDFVPGSFAKWKTLYDIIPLASSLGYNLQPVDLGVFGGKKIGPAYNDYEKIDPLKSSFKGRSEDGIHYRDKIMHNVITEGFEQTQTLRGSSILIVGSNHLLGFSKELFPHHNVVLINATNAIFEDIKNSQISEMDDSELANEFVLADKSVRQIKNEPFESIETFWHSVKAMQVASEVHKSRDRSHSPTKMLFFPSDSLDKKIDCPPEIKQNP